MPNRDAKRDIGAELLASVLEMKAGKTGRIHRIPTTLSYQDVIARGFTIDGTPDADVLKAEEVQPMQPASRVADPTLPT